jgi:hypothetical protein
LLRAYEMSFAAVQKHVAVLERAGLIQKRANGREQLVSTNHARLQRAGELLDYFESIWRQRMAQLDDVLLPKENDMPLTSVTKTPQRSPSPSWATIPFRNNAFGTPLPTRASSSAFGDHPSRPPPSRVMTSQLAVAPSTS